MLSADYFSYLGIDAGDVVNILALVCNGSAVVLQQFGA